MFADDTACANADSNLDSLLTRANSELKKVALWFRANKMAVNIGKTKFIVFHNRGKIVDMNGRHIIYDNNEPLADDPRLVVPLERYHDAHPKLSGIHLDEHLNFNFHTNFLCNKLSRSLF
jgi:hypothetical protein